MKRGKDEEKPMEPMFPRLHVNDTEKGGPRAPPRNKMALYEQLSIPSQRLNSSSKTVPPSSSSQGGASERGSFFSLRQPPSVQEQKKKHEDDDFTVPVFVRQSGISPNRTWNHQSKDNECHSLFDSSSSRNTQKNSKDFAKSALNQLSTQIAKNPSKQTNGSTRFGHESASNNQQEVVRIPNDPNNGDAVSETSMVDSLSGLDISPDDVVGIIGQKHFWKARRAIVSQQQVFAVQVFELHRLIKVQRLIAGSPQSLAGGDGSHSGKPPEVSPIEKILLEPAPTVPKRNDTEFSAENVVGTASLSSVQHSTWTTGSGPFPGYTLPPSDPKTGSWSFDRPAGNQWLIPVMTPTEGLVYKPYPGPGFMSTVCGGCGPPAPAPAPTPPIGHNFVNYGVPPPLPPPSHSYFPPYTTNPNPSSGPDETNPSGQQAVPNPSSGPEETDPTGQQAVPNVVKVQNALPLFPPSPAGRVIRVVPHNAQSATESVARIFRSIQEERKHHHHDSV